MIAGYTARCKVIASVGELTAWLKKIFCRYYVPYLFMMVLSDGISLDNLVDYVYVELWRLQRHTPLASWWLPCFILVVVLFQIATQVMKDELKCGCAMMVLFPFAFMYSGNNIGNQLYFWNIALMGGAFFGLGLVLRNILEKAEEKICFINHRACAVGISFIFFVVLMHTYRNNDTVFMVIGLYGNTFWFICNAIIGFFWCIYAGKTFNNKVLAYLGRNSIIVMMYHHWFISIANRMMAYYVAGQGSYVVRILQAVFEVLMCVPLIWLINNYMPWLVGKSNNSRK